MLLVVLMLLACSAPDASREALVKAGYTDIETGGWTPMACSDSDTFTTTFRAKNPAGGQVEGVVCCGWMKRCTIRF